jgi:hypothetical protein
LGKLATFLKSVNNPQLIKKVNLYFANSDYKRTYRLHKKVTTRILSLNIQVIKEDNVREINPRKKQRNTEVDPKRAEGKWFRHG